MIRAGPAINDYEMCFDMLYGVDHPPTEKRNCKGNHGMGGRTGLIVWAEPWKTDSWEVDEGFARKYKWLLGGCDDLVRSTNSFRLARGERMLDLGD